MNLFFSSPLEQFELNVYIPLFLFDFDLSINTSVFYLLVVFFFLNFLLFFFLFSAFLIPHSGQWVMEVVYIFILGMYKEQLGHARFHYFPVFFAVFCFILFSNLFGLVPFSFTVTAQLVVTFSLALSFNLAFILEGFYSNGVKFLKIFVPNGAPVVLLPLIVVIELVSYLIRTLSLSVRLFANMMAGHTLLHILSSFSLIFVNYKFPSLLFFIPMFMVFLVFFLELAIAFIQSYVFTILLCIYLSDAYNPSH